MGTSIDYVQLLACHGFSNAVIRDMRAARSLPVLCIPQQRRFGVRSL